MHVFGLMHPDTLSTIFDSLLTLLPCDILEAQVLKLPDAVVDQWTHCCSGVINLQSITVLDVTCLLKLIDRLSLSS